MLHIEMRVKEMELEYIKLNKNKLDFSTGVNYILGDSNSGKSTLYRILKYIYGGNEERDNDFNGNKWKNLLGKNPNSSIEWKFRNGETFKLDLASKIIFGSKGRLSISEYRDYISNKKDFSHKILGKNKKTVDCFFWNESPNRLIEDKSKYGRFFDENGIFNITSFKFFHLIDEYDKVAEEYFSLVGRKVNYDKLGKTYGQLEKGTDEDLIKIVSSNTAELDRYYKLKKMNKKKLDDNIIAELKELSNIDIDKVICFHEELINSYNELVEDERNALKKEIKTLGKYTFDEVKEAKSIVDNKELDSEYKSKVTEELNDKVKSIEDYKDRVEDISIDMNKEILRYKNEFSILSDYEFENNIIFKKSGANQNFVINLKNKEESKEESKEKSQKIPGGGMITLNFFIFLFYTFSKSNFPIMIFEKPFFVEVKNSEEIGILNKMNKKLTQKQIFIIQHPEEDFEKISNINTVTIDKLFGIQY